MKQPNKRINPASDAQRVGKPQHISAAPARLTARPQDLLFDPSSTALMVVDMQNAYVSKGGYMETAGFDVSLAQDAVAGAKRAIEIARAAAIQVVYLQNGWDAGYIEAGGPGSPNWHKSNALRTMRQHAGIDGTLLAKGGWDYALVDELQPHPNDIVVAKTRYSGFFNSTLDSTLRARGIRTLVFTGIATNVCVESTLRDAYHLEYFCVLLQDATTHAGPSFTFQAAIYNIETFFGWTSDIQSFEKALTAAKP